MAKATRTTHRSATGKKLYAVRDRQKFKDIQTYERRNRAGPRQDVEGRTTARARQEATATKKTRKAR